MILANGAGAWGADLTTVGETDVSLFQVEQDEFTDELKYVDLYLVADDSEGSLLWACWHDHAGSEFDIRVNERRPAQRREEGDTERVQIRVDRHPMWAETARVLDIDADEFGGAWTSAVDFAASRRFVDEMVGGERMIAQIADPGLFLLALFFRVEVELGVNLRYAMDQVDLHHVLPGARNGVGHGVREVERTCVADFGGILDCHGSRQIVNNSGQALPLAAPHRREGFQTRGAELDAAPARDGLLAQLRLGGRQRRLREPQRSCLVVHEGGDHENGAVRRHCRVASMELPAERLRPEHHAVVAGLRPLPWLRFRCMDGHCADQCGCDDSRSDGHAQRRLANKIAVWLPGSMAATLPDPRMRLSLGHEVRRSTGDR